MTDVQVLTLALGVIIPLSMLIYSNSRITEAKETLRAEIRTETTKLEAKLDTIIAMLGQLDTRVTKLEESIHPR
jgi:hypothetical protein